MARVFPDYVSAAKHLQGLPVRHVRVPEEWVIVRYMRCNAYTITNKLEKVVNVESFLQGAPNVIGHKLARVLSVAALAERTTIVRVVGKQQRIGMGQQRRTACQFDSAHVQRSR